jgi:hypothetical protein
MDVDDRDSELSSRLFSQPSRSDGADGLTYDAVLLEQYKLYVEMADRISARRGLANSFFLTLNTSVIALFAVFKDIKPGPTAWYLGIPLVALVAECFAWFYLVRSYRLLNGAKFRVVGALEERLPASPFWRAEWWALGEGHDRRKYWPLSHIEQWVPILFALTYIGGVVAAALR